jgi:thiosulfate reductase cytochrome b subunit
MTAEDSSPLWLRLWHGAQALLFFGLIATGLCMHYAASDWAFIPFEIAVHVHNACGIATAFLWLIFVVSNAITGHVRHYIPTDFHIIHSAWMQIWYYLFGMFRGEPPPVTPGLRNNPAQQLSYAIAMYVLMPISVVSGVLLLFPILAPERALGRAGLWPMAILHLSVGYLLTLFLVVHMYLATTGETFFSLIREIITGDRESRSKQS